MQVDENNINKRIDKYLSENTEYSRSTIQKMIDNGNITVNNKPTKSSYKLELNDIITIDNNFKEETDILPENIKLDIVYEDDDLMIINKPSGMVVHPGNGNHEHTLVNALLGYTNNLSTNNDDIRPGIVHRIDKDTSGLMVVAKNNKCHELLAEAFKNKTINRYYTALVIGELDTESGIIDAPIGRDPNERKRYTVTKQNSKTAITHFNVIKRYKGYTLLNLKLDTGRTHQIRVHFQGIKHPLVGDGKYGNIQTNRIFEKKFKYKGQFLHAYKMKFDEVEGILSYLSNKEFVCPLNEKEEKILSQIRKEQ